jgi:DNA replication protein DnaC
MLNHPTLDKLLAMKLTGMAAGFAEQLKQPDLAGLTFEERLGLLVDREMTLRDDARMQRALSRAKLRFPATIEDVDYRHPRQLNKALFASLSGCRWIRSHDNVLITGPTGLGKSYLACALADKACREGFTAQYLRLPRLFPDLALAHGDGRFGKLLAGWAKTDVLILDDWGMAPMSDQSRRDLLEILEDRYGRRSTIVTSQFPVDKWHDRIGDPTLADALLDRLVHNAHRIPLDGETMRKPRTKPAKATPDNDAPDSIQRGGNDG